MTALNGLIDKGNLQLWCDELRSGKWTQAKSVLETLDERFCCLGVACKLFIPADMLKLNSAGAIIGRLPQDQPECPTWLKAADLIEFNDGLPNTGLSVLNDMGFKSDIKGLDNAPFTFDEIADIIEAVHILNVLDEPEEKVLEDGATN